MTKFWIYLFFASAALILAFTASNPHGSRDWIIGIWGLIGCFPWWLLLSLVDTSPNGQVTLTHIAVMSALNASVIYCICRARQQQVSLLHYLGFRLGRCVSYFRK